MSETTRPLGITDVTLRDAHQSLLATRMRTEDMLPICGELDAVGFHSLECWGGATFDACVRFLAEDPWARLRQLRAALPNSRTQMLLRGQNLLGYRHYGDDVVRAFVERSVANGMDVFRIFDALNDIRNLETAIAATKAAGAHARFKGELEKLIKLIISTQETWEAYAEAAAKEEHHGGGSGAVMRYYYSYCYKLIERINELKIVLK